MMKIGRSSLAAMIALLLLGSGIGYVSGWYSAGVWAPVTSFGIDGSGNLDVNGIESNTLRVDALTSGRIPIAGTAGLLGDDADLSFTGGNTLKPTRLNTTQIVDTGLTSGRIPITGTGGLLGDDTDLRFVGGDTLTVTNVSTSDLYVNNDVYVQGTNRTDVLAYPEQAASYIIWKDGSVYYTKNTNTGIVTSGTGFVQTTLQNALTACGTAGGGTVYLKVAGSLTVNTLTIPSYVTLEGLNQKATVLVPNTGLSPIIKFDGVTYAGLRNIAISGAGYHNTIGVLIKNSQYIKLENIYINIFNQANGIGLLMNATTGMTTWCQIINPIIINCGTNIKMQGASGHGVNANTFLGGYIAGSTVAGFMSNRYTDTNSFIDTDFDTNAIAISIDGYDHKMYGIRFEGNTNDVTFGVNSYDNVFFGGSSAALVLSDLGLRNRFNDVIGYVTKNSGTFSIALHATTATITHGLSYTPAATDITITWTTVGGLLNCTSWSVTGIGAATFTVNLYDANGAAKGPSGTVTGSWAARKTP